MTDDACSYLVWPRWPWHDIAWPAWPWSYSSYVFIPHSAVESVPNTAGSLPLYNGHYYSGHHPCCRPTPSTPFRLLRPSDSYQPWSSLQRGKIIHGPLQAYRSSDQSKADQLTCPWWQHSTPKARLQGHFYPDRLVIPSCILCKQAPTWPSVKHADGWGL